MKWSFLRLIGALDAHAVYRAPAGEGGDDGAGGGGDSGGGGEDDSDIDPAILRSQLAEARRIAEQERKGRVKLLDEARRLREELSGKAEIDPEEYRTLKEAAEAQKLEEQRKQGDYQQSLKVLAEKHAAEKQSLEARARQAEQTANDLFAEREINRAFKLGNGDEDKLELFAGNIRDYYRVEVDEKGRRSIVFVDPQTGGEEILMTKSRNPIETAPEFIKYLREETKLAFYFLEDPTPKGTNVTKQSVRRSADGKIRVDESDPIAYGKYAEQLATGEAVGFN